MASILGDAIFTLPNHDVTGAVAAVYDGQTGSTLIFSAMMHGMATPPFWLAVFGIFFAWYCYCKNTELPGKIASAFGPIYRILDNKYGFDNFYQTVFAKGAVTLGKLLYKHADAGLIDGAIVNGTANTVGVFSSVLRRIQTGYTYHYAFAMIIGLFGLITIFIWL